MVKLFDIKANEAANLAIANKRRRVMGGGGDDAAPAPVEPADVSIGTFPGNVSVAFLGLLLKSYRWHSNTSCGGICVGLYEREANMFRCDRVSFGVRNLLLMNQANYNQNRVSF